MATRKPAPAGKDETPKRAPARKTTQRTASAVKTPDKTVAPSTQLADVYGGVSTTWLGQMFEMDKGTVAKKLAKGGVQPVGTRNGGNLYRLKEAAQYLVEPKVDLVSYIQSLRPNDLPPVLSSYYWDAMLKRQKWEENAGELWRTEDVLAVLGDLAMTLKSTITLWVEEIDRRDGVTPAQRKTLEHLVDDLLLRIHVMLTEAPRKGRTKSSLSEDGAIPDDAVIGDDEEAVDE